MKKVIADELKNEAKTALNIVDTLCENGFEAYLVGGAVRDILCGKTPSDLDIVTNAKPEKIKSLFKNTFKVKIAGAGFKVCLVSGIEVATYRKWSSEGYFVYADSIFDDINHRDFTINAIAMCPYTGDIKDKADGVNDLKNKIIRFRGMEADRIKEDPCRIIRAARFAAKINGTIAPDSFSAMKAHAHLVKNEVAPERIRLEIMKAMKCRKPSLFFNLLREAGALTDIFPSLVKCYGLDGGSFHDETVWDHSMDSGDFVSPSRPVLRLAMYLHDVGKPLTAKHNGERVTFIGHETVGAETIRNELWNLKFSIEEIDKITGIIKHHMRTVDSETSPKAIRKMLRRFKEDGVDFKDWIGGRISDRKANRKKDSYTISEVKTILNAINRELTYKGGKGAFSVKDLAVNGNDIIKELGLKPGPEVGEHLEMLLEAVIDKPDINNREELLRLIKKEL